MSTSGGMWKVEVKLPYGFVGTSYDFPVSSQRTVFFNWETNTSVPHTEQATTNPNRLFWPVIQTNPWPQPTTYVYPEVGVSRP